MKKRYSASWKSLVIGAAVAMAAVPAYADGDPVDDHTLNGAHSAPYVDFLGVGWANDNLVIDADASLTGAESGTTAHGVRLPDAYSGEATNNGGIDISSTGTGGDGGNASATAYGIDVAGILNGSLANGTTGDITATAMAINYGSDYGQAYAYGVYIGGEGAADSSISNSGHIEATATGAEGYSIYNANAAGIFVDDDFAGSISNTSAETIVATAIANGAGGEGSASGIYVNGELSGTITNSGSIEANATANGSNGSASAVGISMDGELSGAITNSGSIEANATANGSNGSAYGAGIYVGGPLSGSLSNSGSIEANGTADGTSGFAYAGGIYIDGDLAGSISNTSDESIIVTANANGEGGFASADGIAVYGNLSGTITNSGTITVTGNANGSNGSATVAGIYVDGDMTAGSISNSGAISATANAWNNTDVGNPDNAHASGIWIDGSVSQGASVTNAEGGTITATATASSYAYAYGIRIGGALNGTIANNGEINVTAAIGWEPHDHGTYAYGIYVDGNDSYGSISNTHNITVTATSNGSDANAYGIYTNNLTGEGAGISNSGTITARAEVGAGGTSDASAYGIRVGSLTTGATITNSGAITAYAEHDGAQSTYDANAAGISAYSLAGEGAAITNTAAGTINVTAIGGATSYSGYGANAYAAGIYVNTNVTSGAGITNNGIITVNATGAEGYVAGAAGIMVEYGSLGADAFITNNGTITVSATGAEGMAAGIYVGGDMDGSATITNTGTITATATPSSAPGIYADGIFVVGNMNGTIINTGVITAINEEFPDQGYSIVTHGESGTGTVYNYSTGELHGNINLAGSVSLYNSGLVHLPAEANAYVGGNYTQAEGGVFKIDVKNVGEGDVRYGNLTVNGTATLENNANIRVNVNPGTDLTGAEGRLARVIDASGVTTLYSGPNYNVTDNSVRYQFTAEEIADDEYGVIVGEGGVLESHGLNLVVTETGMSSFANAAQQGGLGGGSGLGALLDDFYENGAPNADFEELLYTLGSLGTPAAVADGMSKLQPLLSGGASGAALGALHSANRVIQSRLGLAANGLSFGDEAKRDSRAWLKPFGSWTDQDDRKGAIGYDADTYGIAVGADTEVTSDLRLGAAFTYSKTDVDGNNGYQSADVNTYQVAIYGSYKLDDSTEINFQGDVGKSSYEGLRHINIGLINYNALSDFDSFNYHLGAGLGRNIKLSDKTTFTPSLRVDYTSVDADGYTETGNGPFNLKVDSHTVDELVFAVDGKLSHNLNASTVLTGNLGLGYDAIGDQATINSSFVGGGSSFVTEGIDPSNLIIRGGLGLVLSPASGIEIVTRYDVEAREDYTNQTGSIKFRMPF